MSRTTYRFHLLCLWALGSWAVGVATPVQAQCEDEPEVSDQQRAQARERFRDGVQASQDRRWTAARDSFQAAYDIAPFAPIVYNLATSQARSGYIVEATENYRRFLRRCRSRDEAMSELRADAEERLADISPRVARLSLAIENFNDEVDRIDMDGQRIPGSAIGFGTNMPINPGDHQITVHRGREQIESHSFSVGEGEAASVELTVPVYVPPVITDEDYTWVAVVAVIGAVVLGVGVGLGVFFGTQGNNGPVDGNWPPAQFPLIEF